MSPVMCDTTIQPRDLASAVGAELSRVRTDHGWSVSGLARRVPGLTLADLRGKEGARYRCGLLEVVTLCQAMAVPAPDVLALAMQRLQLDLELITLRVDLHSLAIDARLARFWPLRRWACMRLAAGHHRHGVVQLDPRSVARMAERLRVDSPELIGYLACKPPASVRGSARCATRGNPDSPHNRTALTKRMLSRALGFEVRRIRLDHGWTAGDLAARLPLSVGTKSVYGYESGGVPDSVARLVELGQALTVPGPELLDRALSHIDAVSANGSDPATSASIRPLAPGPAWIEATTQQPSQRT